MRCGRPTPGTSTPTRVTRAAGSGSRDRARDRAWTRSTAAGPSARRARCRRVRRSSGPRVSSSRVTIILAAVTATTLPVPAFKEWAVVVRALVEGEQILDVRKGGLREEGRHFSVHAMRVWLYPTVEHQQADLVKPAYRRWIDTTEAEAPPERAIRIEGWADIVGVATVTEPEALDALDGKVVWSRAYVETRYRWKARDPLHVLALRVHRLTDPVTVPYRDEYGGCTSWVDLDGLGDPESVTSTPALSDVAFDARLKGAAEAVGGFAPPQTER